MKNIDVAEIPITPFRKEEIISELLRRVSQKERTFIITPYSEFIYAAFYSDEVRDVFKRADISLADGIGVAISDTFLHRPLTFSSFYGKIFQALVQLISTLTSALLNPKSLYNNIPEKIVGADFFWNIVEIAEEQQLRVFLLGGFDDVPEKVALEVKKKYPLIQIVGYSNKGPHDPEVISELERTKPDLLFVAYGPVIQERFIVETKNRTHWLIAMGVGGTFDYISGEVHSPRSFFRKRGLEWVFRLFTQKNRAKRIWNATAGLLECLLRYKVYESMPYRKNAIAAIIKASNILICKRKPLTDAQFGMSFQDYWQLPQGGIEEGEEVAVGASREAMEETGLTDLRLLGVSKQTFSYRWRNARRPLLKHPFLKKYRFKGQEQSIVYFENLGTEGDVVLDNREFIEYRWVPISAALESVHPERREVMNFIVRDLENFYPHK